MKIVSGGQTGVDRAALDVAMALGLERGGWCPAGRWAEDGPIDTRYPLVETPSADPAQRTEWNVRDTGATLILTDSARSPGTELAEAVASRLGRPLCIIAIGALDVEAFRDWLRTHAIASMNVAGPREREAPGVYRRAYEALETLLQSIL
jgi:hypothetical protein